MARVRYVIEIVMEQNSIWAQPVTSTHLQTVADVVKKDLPGEMVECNTFVLPVTLPSSLRKNRSTSSERR